MLAGPGTGSRPAFAHPRKHLSLPSLHRQADPSKWSVEKQAAYRARLAKIRNGRLMQTLGMVQDLADAFLAMGDIRGDSKALQNPVLQAAAGLLSGTVSGYTKWPGVKL